MTSEMSTDTLISKASEQSLVLPGRYDWDHLRSLRTWVEDTTGLKITYLDGHIELMTTGKPHERIKKLIAILIEAYCFELGIRFFPAGNATCEAEEKGASFNPDESYCFETDKDYPDLGIEVVFTSGGIDKLEKYRRFNVPEVWFWQNDQLSVYVLTNTPEGIPQYVSTDRSRWFPNLDLPLFSSCVTIEDAFEARSQFLAALKSDL
jgi:Uma2 family endonuclease